jgi:MFS family permease
VTFLNDLSSEVVIRTLPLFLADVLGVKTVVIGLIEGLAESTATLLKVASGYIADRVGRRKTLAVFGYGLSNFAKPLLFFAAGWPLVLFVRVLDRIGNGLRSAPKDALIADATAPEHRGRAFGFNKAMDKAGGVLGLLFAALILHLGQTGGLRMTAVNYRSLVLLSVIPGVAAVVVMIVWVTERPRSTTVRAPTIRLAWQSLTPPFKLYLALMVLFTLGNSSDAFLMLRAQSIGLSPLEILLVLAGFNVVITASATPGGALSDLLGRRRLIAVGWIIYAVIYLGFAAASTRWHVWALYLGYGLYYGAFQGAASALVADLVPADLRGTAYGLFNATIGVAALPASVIAGLLWDRYGAPAPFGFGAALAIVAAAAMLVTAPPNGYVSGEH